MYLKLFSLLLSFIYLISQNCDPISAREIGKSFLKSYLYDVSKITYFYPSEQITSIELDIPLLSTESYILIFVMQGKLSDVEIRILDAPKFSKNRKLLFSSSNTQPLHNNPLVYTYELNKGKNLYLEYKSKSGKPISPSGCITLIVGYSF